MVGNYVDQSFFQFVVASYLEKESWTRNNMHRLRAYRQDKFFFNALRVFGFVVCGFVVFLLWLLVFMA